MELKIEGMSCGHCVRAVTRALQAVDPGARVAVDLAQGRVAVEGALSPEHARKAIEAAGYAVVEPGSAAGAARGADGSR